MLGLGLKPSIRTAIDPQGFFLDTGAYWTHDISASSTSLDDLTGLTVIIHMSWSARGPQHSGYTFPHLLYAFNNTGSDKLGFKIHSDTLSKKSESYALGQCSLDVDMSDGSGAMTSLGTDANDVARFGYNRAEATTDSKKLFGCPSFANVVRFKAGATNEQQIALLSNTNIKYYESNNDVANLGQISDTTNIQIGNNNGDGHGGINWTDYTIGNVIIHKISVWNTALGDGDILKLTGFNGSTLEDTTYANLDGFYHDPTRFQGYAELGVDTPEHNWNFTRPALQTYTSGTLSDTGNQSDLDMSPVGNPVIGSRGQV